MQLQPGLGPLVECDAGEKVAAEAQHHDEDPGLAVGAGLRVVELAQVAEVHLGDLAGRRLDGDGHVLWLYACLLPQAAAEALHGPVAAGEAVVFEFQAVIDGLGPGALAGHADDQVGPGLDGRGFLGSRLGWVVGEDGGLEGLQVRDGVGIAIQQPRFCQGLMVRLSGLAAHAEEPGRFPYAGVQAVQAHEFL